MAGERGEVDVQRGQVDRLVRHRLAGVQHRQCADRLGPGHQLGDRCAGTGDIGVMGEGDDLDPLIQGQGVEVDVSVVGHPVPAQGGTGPAGQLLPGDQIGVVLQFGGDDDVAGADGSAESVVAQHIGDQVESLGGVLGEHQAFRCGADEAGDIGSAVLEGVGGLLHELMGPAVHRAVGGGQEVSFGVEHRQRLLRGRPGVQVGQLVSAAHDPVQDREVGADLLNLDAGLDHCRHAGAWAAAPARVNRT